MNGVEGVTDENGRLCVRVCNWVGKGVKEGLKNWVNGWG